MESIVRIKHVHVSNFASYKELNFSLNTNELTLIHGPTGSGKSTLCDTVPWILFGKTAKGGNADEVISWTGGVTQGTAEVVLPNGNIVTVVRCRGKNANDLYYGDHCRGKDLNDTQKKINNLLGMDYELYLSGAYFHEFSQTAQFFTTTPKNRRAICEQLVDLSLSKKLSDKLSVRTKEVKEKLAISIRKQELTLNKIETLETNIKHEKTSVQYFNKQKVIKIKELEEKYATFDLNKTKQIEEFKTALSLIKVQTPAWFAQAIENLQEYIPPKTEPCKECGSPKHNERREELLAKIQVLKQKEIENKYKLREVRSLQTQIKAIEESINVYGEQLKELEDKSNPYESSVARLSAEKADAVATSLELATEIVNQSRYHTALEELANINADFRGLLIKNTILDIETKTNLLLSNHFDAEIKIELSIEDADKVEVSINKDGNECVYTQLSKGQRQLLKLCFGVSVMESVQNHHGIRFEQLFFDEATDGLDEDNKLKAVKMLETLAVDRGVYIVEHSAAIKAAVNTKYAVELVNGASVIYEEA